MTTYCIWDRQVVYGLWTLISKRQDGYNSQPMARTSQPHAHLVPHGSREDIATINLQVCQPNGTAERIHKLTRNYIDDIMIAYVRTVSTPHYNIAYTHVVLLCSTPSTFSSISNIPEAEKTATAGNPSHHPRQRPKSVEVIIWVLIIPPEMEQLHMQHSAVIANLTYCSIYQ